MYASRQAEELENAKRGISKAADELGEESAGSNAGGDGDCHRVLAGGGRAKGWQNQGQVGGK